MSMAVNPNFKLRQIDLSDDTTVLAAGTDSKLLRPDVGKIYQVMEIESFVPDPSGSGSGTHKMEVLSQAGTSAVSRKLMVTGNSGSSITIGQYQILTGDAELPAGAVEQGAILLGAMWCDNTMYITLKYTNNTDVSQTGNRAIKVLVREFTEAIT